MSSPCFDGEPIFDEVPNDSITEYKLPLMEVPHFVLRYEKIQQHVGVTALRGEEHLVSLETMKSKVEAGNTMAAMAAAASPLPSLLAAGNLTPSSIAHPHPQAGAVGSSESEFATPSFVHDDSVALIAFYGRCDYARANEMTSAQIDAMAQDETYEIANTVEHLTGLGVEKVVATALRYPRSAARHGYRGPTTTAPATPSTPCFRWLLCTNSGTQRPPTRRCSRASAACSCP